MSLSNYALNERINYLQFEIDNLTPPAGGYVPINGNTTINNIKTFTTLPQSTVVPLNNADLVNKLYVDGFVPINGNTTINNVKTFSTLPQSSVVPVSGNDLVNKTYADGLVGATPTLNQVLSAGNTATGSIANINLVDTDVGGQANPILNLQNTNATGSVSMEIYKNKPTAGIAGDVLFNQSVYGKDAGNLKQEYTRISHTLRDASIGGEDGSIEFSAFVNGAVNTFLQINGNENEINCLKNLDMGGNNIRTSTGDLSILTTTSSGNGNMTISTNGSNAVGDITISAKNNMVLSCGTAPDTIDLQGGVKMTNGRQITFTNTSNSDTGIAQSQAFTITDGTETGTLQKGTIQTLNATSSNTMNPTKLNLVADGGNTTAVLANNDVVNESSLRMFNNDGGGIYQQSGIISNSSGQELYLNATNNAVSKDIVLRNTVGGALIYNNIEDNNGFTVVSNYTNLRLQTTGIVSGQGDIEIAPSQNGSANGQLVFTGASLQSNTAGGNSGEHLVIVLNGNTYKIKLENP